MSTPRETLTEAFRDHLAHPDDPATARRLYDTIAISDRRDVDAALSEALLTRPPVAPPPLMREPTPAPVAETLAAAAIVPVGPRPETPPATNWAGNVDLRGALAALEVSETSDVQQAVAKALAASDSGRRAARALGTGHSSSHVLTTRGTIVDTGVLVAPIAPKGALRRMMALDPSELAPGVSAEGLVRVGAGLRVREVAEALSKVGRALPMLGAYSGQTYVGALCTGTHGTGIDHGALHTRVRSIDIVTVDASRAPRLLRIERSAGISAQRTMPPGALIQDDDTFRAALVGIGNLGVITSVVVETVPHYHLVVHRTHHDWNAIRALLTDVDERGYPTAFAGTYCAGVLMNPYPWPIRPAGPRKAVVTRAYVASRPPPVPEPPTPPGGCPLLFDIARFLGNATALTPWALDMAIDTMRATTNEYGAWWEVLAGRGELPQGYSVEYGFPLDRFLPALDAILDAMYELAWRDTKMVAGTLSLRFVRGDDADLSMAEGRDTAFVEILTLSGIHDAPEVFARTERIALAHGARPHWGQWFDPESVPKIVSHYPRAASYVTKGLDRLDPTRAFENEISRAIRAAL
ncbi:D-arabinono-1,4-lactone oxidase [Sandaracinus amylolyticus]|uniref:D-arabinono-1,4-lactone oxidase n=1 Tax=Sandaracinus amylolyticus TaxID=927083 RepID=UPI001F3D1702|nr:D-arabinono-1,4-lactone oxidase [Sandaracinus amylolyticus]UJR85620.1 Hypothetical protein I5071_77000 [Sandaracinus amylolyticus]